MIVEEFPHIINWLFQEGAIVDFLRIAVAAILCGLFLGFLKTSVRRGPGEAFYTVSQTIFQAVPDFFKISLRRIFAVAMVAWKENIRLLWLALILYLVAMGVAGLYIKGGSTHPERNFIGFVYYASQVLSILFAVLVSAFSLPSDILNRTIYTVVTKPVRITEVVMGRIVGFMMLGTVLLTVLGVSGYIFVWRGLDHTHQPMTKIGADQWVAVVDGQAGKGRRPFHSAAVYELAVPTSIDNEHAHRIALIDAPTGSAHPYDVVVEEVSGHVHEVLDVKWDSDNQFPVSFGFGRAHGNLKARRPVYAKDTPNGKGLMFTDSAGNLTAKGINVGYASEYMEYIKGGTDASAIFRFEGIFESNWKKDEDILVDLDLSVFRLVKANIKKRVIAQLEIRNVVDQAETDQTRYSVKIPFETQEFKVQTLIIPRVSPNGSILGKEKSTIGDVDFFRDLAQNGQVELVLRCSEPQQHLGVAQASIYFRAGDGIYGFNFFKGYLGLWALMLVIVSMTVALSCFLKGPVVLLGTVCLMIVGYSGGYIAELTKEVSGEKEFGHSLGGGPMEATYRLITQMNLQQPLPDNVGSQAIEFVDQRVLVPMISSAGYSVPRLNRFDMSDYLSYGYVIDNHHIGICFLTSIIFALAMWIFGYFCLKTKEIAAAS